MASNYITIDTEGRGTVKTAKAYDVAIIVHDNNGVILYKYNAYIQDVYNTIPWNTSKTYKKKAKKYEAIKADFITAAQFKKHLNNIIQQYNVSEVYAFNMFSYDFITLMNTGITLPRSVKIGDTLGLVYNTIYKTQAYKAFCQKHGFVRKNGVARCTAETVYSFITQNPNYKEEHTALADALIETEIFAECMRMVG